MSGSVHIALIWYSMFDLLYDAAQSLQGQDYWHIKHFEEGGMCSLHYIFVSF